MAPEVSLAHQEYPSHRWRKRLAGQRLAGLRQSLRLPRDRCDLAEQLTHLRAAGEGLLRDLERPADLRVAAPAGPAERLEAPVTRHEVEILVELLHRPLDGNAHGPRALRLEHRERGGREVAVRARPL